MSEENPTLVLLKHQLSLPIREEQWENGFDPWEALPHLYGSYSSAFDIMAIQVLESLNSQSHPNETLAHEMFREILCTSGLCDYWTSPRSCFPTNEFLKIIPQLIEKWKLYYESQWGEDFPYSTE